MHRTRNTFLQLSRQGWQYHQKCFPALSSLDINLNWSFRSSSNKSGEYQQKHTKHIVAAVGTACLLGYSLYWKVKFDKLKAAEIEPGSLSPGLPVYTRADVAKHKTKDTRIWVTYKNAVYDITDYASKHPGGNKILLAAGGPLEPFWNMYAVHKQKEIIEIAEKYRIGNITEVSGDESLAADDPYAKDPSRSPLLIPSSTKPYNGEPPAQLLVENFITPTDLFFVRNHLPVPNINLKTYCLNIQGATKELKFSLCDLKNKFKKKSVIAVVQCAGNRRSEMVKIKPVKGLNWQAGAIGNAVWSGVALTELLKQAGIDLDCTQKKHLVFEGLDKGPEGSFYGASLPIELAKSLKDDIIIAYEMNGTDIPRDHGYPVRVIIPGVVGARQVKWLHRIYLSDEESESHWQRLDYKGFNSSVDWHNVNFESAFAIMKLPVISAICDPPEGTELEEGAEEVTIRGYAWSGGGNGIIRVDVSADGGQTWHTADIEPNGQSQYRSYAWSLWEASIPLPKFHKGEVELVCKAVDVAYNVQPENFESIWNLRGVLGNAWHRVKIKVPAAKEE